MKEIEIFVHTHEGAEPRLVKAGEDSTVNELIQKINEATGFKGGPNEQVLLFLEDFEDPLNHHHKLCECEIRHHHHVHCHKCHKIQVVVFYNRAVERSFAPSTKVERVLEWAIKELKLTPNEAADKLLTLKGSAEELPLDAHIGSFAKPGECAVNLCLTAPVEVNG